MAHVVARYDETVSWQSVRSLNTIYAAGTELPSGDTPRSSAPVLGTFLASSCSVSSDSSDWMRDFLALLAGRIAHCCYR